MHPLDYSRTLCPPSACDKHLRPSPQLKSERRQVNRIYSIVKICKTLCACRDAHHSRVTGVTERCLSQLSMFASLCSSLLKHWTPSQSRLLRSVVSELVYGGRADYGHGQSSGAV